MAPHINLEFSLFFSEGWSDYITGFCVAVILPAWWRLPHWYTFCTLPLLCHARGRQKIVLTSFFWSCVNIFRMTAVFLELWKTAPPHPSPSSALLLITSRYISPSAQTNETKRGLLCSGCQIHFQCGWGSQWNYVMIARSNWECRLKWCCSSS